MSSIRVYGNQYLQGVVRVNGAKNAAIPLICASLVVKGKVLLKNVPRISDVFDLVSVLKKLDCSVKFKGHMLLIDNTNLKYKPLIFDECRRIRGSYYLIGAFLSLFSKCEILLPGGCSIGKRPIDLHLKAFEDLGYSYVILEEKLILNKKYDLKESTINFDKLSVGASINALLAGLSLDRLVINNGLFEPEGLDVIKFLNNAGYNIDIKDSIIYIKSKLDFKTVKHNIVTDRIEAMTYVVLGLLSGKLIIKNVNTSDLIKPLKLLKNAHYDISYTKDEIKVGKCLGGPLDFETAEFPGIPTDIQPILGVLAAYALGDSFIKENIFENRYKIYDDLKRIGVDVTYSSGGVIVKGCNYLMANEFEVCDLRHGAAIILLCMKLNGISIIHNYELVQRGYEDFILCINRLGGKIEVIE